MACLVSRFSLFVGALLRGSSVVDNDELKNAIVTNMQLDGHLKEKS